MTAILASQTGTITAEEIRLRADLLRQTQTVPKPRLVETGTLNRRVDGSEWRQVDDALWEYMVGAGNVTCYWSSPDGTVDRPYYYVHHSAAASVYLTDAAALAVSGRWELYGTFGGVLALIDSEPFTAPLQPRVATRSWVHPETIQGRLTLQTAVNPAQVPINLNLQWALTLTQTIR